MKFVKFLNDKCSEDETGTNIDVHDVLVSIIVHLEFPSTDELNCKPLREGKN